MAQTLSMSIPGALGTNAGAASVRRRQLRHHAWLGNEA